MLTFAIIGCLLTAYIQPSLPDEEDHDLDDNEHLSQPTINSPSTEVAIGENVTLKCSSKTGSLPIKYTLYKGQDRMLPPASKNKKGQEAEFHVTINLTSELGEYKCKAENKFGINKYSLGFNFTLREPLSQPVVYSSSAEVHIGENVTLSCFSRNGSLPIKYTLYRGQNRVLTSASKNKTGEAAEFHFPINLSSALGEYKCKAENRFTNVYSRGFNFTMRAGKDNLVLFVVPPLLLLLLALVLAIPLLILPSCKAGKQRDIPPTGLVPTSYPGSENDVTYTEIAQEKVQEEYVNLEFSNKKDKRRKVSFRDATVDYSEVVRR